jgi:hypothetical protein
MVPVIAAMGEKDPFFQAHFIMADAFRAEGLPFTNLISPGTGHVQDPKTWSEQMRLIADRVNAQNRSPKRVRFLTWTLKYSRCHWVELLSLGAHYRRAEVEAQLEDDGTVTIAEPRNVTRLAIYRGRGKVRIGRTSVSIPELADSSRGLVLERKGSRWRYVGYRDAWKPEGKRPGIQGPIDDAFTSRFLCVRPTGTPWNPEINGWASGMLRQFAYEWERYFRGVLPIKDDTEVTEEDRRSSNLILFGDPGSNRIMREVLGKLPLKWTPRELRLGRSRYVAATHSPALIAPSPFSASKYVVLNSGHTFHEAELSRLNYLLFPRLGDWAVFKLIPVLEGSPKAPIETEVVKAGYFGEDWLLK